MTSSFDKVAEFNTTFGNAVRTEPGLGYDDVKMRLGLLVEEVRETQDAYAVFKFLPEVREVLEFFFRDDFLIDSAMERLLEKVNVEFLDGLADVRVVNEGLAQATGMPINEAFDAVHASNMSKAQPDGSVLRREDGKVLKGVDYFAPTEDLNKILGYK